MALFKPLKGDSSRISLEVTPFHDGYAYLTTDDGGFYIDAVNNGQNKRIHINDPSTLNSHIANKNNPHGITAEQIGADTAGSAAAVAATLTSHTSNSSNPHNVTAEQVGARPNTWLPTAAEVGAVPTGRTVNGKALSADISLSAADVGAAASSHTHAASDITSGVTNNTSTASSIAGSTNLPTMNTLRYALNRTTSVGAADTSYTTYMARGMSLRSSAVTPTYNGQIAWTYE